MILLILTGIGFLIYFVVFHKPTNIQVAQSTPQNTTSPTPLITASSAPDTTMGWKTYSNTEYGFQIKYPSDWTEKPTAGGIQGGSNISQFIVLDTNFRLPDSYESGSVYFDLTSFDFEGKTIQEWVEGLKSKGQVNAKIQRSFSINGYTFFEIDGLGSMYETKEYFVKINGKYLNFGLEPFPSELESELKNLEEILIQILSTFKLSQ